ncbi:MAG TPA: hypothetical protein VGR56_05280 [Nitrososphaerales archaeon]|nr:hypothetical protein [Nitrososphaerales archaeon]
MERQERDLLALEIRPDIRFERVQLLTAIVGILKRIRAMADKLCLQRMSGMKLARLFSQAAV